jgi:energy-coupling factor transport system permease protein
VKLHPAAWILWATCAGIVAVTTTNPFYLGTLVAVAWFVYSARRIQGPTARSFRTFALAGLVTLALRTALVFFGTISVSNVAYALFEGFRLATLLVVFGTFNSVADPFGVIRLAPRRFHEPALAAALALSIAPRTIAAAARVREAQRMRGIRVARWSSLPALAVPVLTMGMEEAVTLAESMDSRGHGRGTRTRYRPQPWTPSALVMTVGAAVGMAAFVAAAWLGLGGLQPPTAPLGWPSVNLALIGMTVLFAAPAVVPVRTEGEQ